MLRSIRAVVLLAVMMGLTITPVRGQNVVLTGAITGRITDPSGAAIPGVTVVVLNLQTGVTQSSVASHIGLYRFPVLSPGGYSITVSKTGFRQLEIRQVRVLIGNTTVQDIELQVGATGESITVMATNPLLRPTESSVSTVIERSFLDNLPLSGRRYTDFTLLAPNTSADGPLGLVSIAGQQGGEDTGYANGNGSNFLAVDGTSATNNYFGNSRGGTRIPYTFGEDAIQEFQVAENPYSSVYGGGGTGFINTVTRSGSDNFHGGAFYYNRNSATAANDTIDRESGFPKPQNALQQFGAALGGPIIRNRLWFFLDYEQQLENTPISVINQPIAQADQTSFGVPAGIVLPPPNGPLPVPGSDSSPDPSNPVYLQQVSNALRALDSNLGVKPSNHNDIALFSRFDYQASSLDKLFLSLNLDERRGVADFVRIIGA